jgi:iron(III) transport system ATP-binding protein
MNAFKLLEIMPKYENCPRCGSSKVGNGSGKIIIEDDTFTRECKCGFKITVHENGNKIKK